MRLALKALAISLASISVAYATPAYIRFPTLQGQRAVITAEGDLWSVPTEGGLATRLTSHPSQETHATLSRDGQWLAFTASYEGKQEAYVMPAAGGTPKRLTYNGERTLVLGFTAQGQVLFTTRDSKGLYGQRVVGMVDPRSGKQTIFPLSGANDAALSDDGKTLFFVRGGLAATLGDNARFYQGGNIAELWRYQVGTEQEASRIDPQSSFSDRRPMLWQGRLYFISNRSGRDNIWSMTQAGQDLRQHTQHQDFDIRYASLSDGKIAYQLGADLHILNVATGGDSTVPVTLQSDFDQRRERLIKTPLTFNANVNFSPKGDKVVLNARGRVVVANNSDLRRVNIATPPGSRTSAPVLSPDGKWLYAVNDATGESEIWRFPTDGSSGGTALTHDSKVMRLRLQLSADGKWLVHIDKAGQLWLLNTETGKNALIDKSESSEYGQIAFSPDHQYLVVTRPQTDINRYQLVLIRLADRHKQILTSDRYENHAPVFSPDGKWLYFLSDRHFQSTVLSPWGDRNTGPFFDQRTQIYALALQPGLRFPFAIPTELDKAAPDAPKSDKASDQDKKDKPALPAIQLAGLADRLFEVPIGPGNYGNLSSDGKRLYFTETEAGKDGKITLKSLAINDQKPEPEVFLADIRHYMLSDDGKKILIHRGPKEKITDLYIVEAGPKAPTDLNKSQVKIADWSIHVKPTEEWQQQFVDAWRMERDFLYDGKLRGVDWPAMRRKYEPLVARINDRVELNDLLAQMMSELGSLHSQVGGGDVRQVATNNEDAYLGAVLTREAQGFRIQHIYQTDPELPSERSPLAQPGVDAKAGDLIVAVNGQPIPAEGGINELLRNQTDQQVLLTLLRDKTEHRVVVKPVPYATHAELRYEDWRETRRAMVDASSQGKIGYLHLQAMSNNDIADFVRQFYAQIDRDGLIIDARGNQGGSIDSWVIEKLLRRVWGFWQSRHGQLRSSNMQQTFRGHLVVLINELTYSDGETFAAAVKALKLGPLIGRRTSGAGVWLSDGNVLSDAGIARASESAQFLASSGEWLIEGRGVQPDIELDNLPLATYRGQDKQLEKAIEWLQSKVKAEPIKPLQPQAIPPLPTPAK
ncbi:tricorn protease [Chitinivorax tropicus]|uniref:Tricorn protease homolog n=1 Tax=Chitinivorax tropicus TaxID=714531 RepID=A0A840MMY5_9PROT|nr:S41 family peptidase [Chitinivorax tropicus]MBB5017553.1 tricorn protease [Chitinivorax tropicus]